MHTWWGTVISKPMSWTAPFQANDLLFFFFTITIFFN